jgi:hypothetical protein
MNFLIHSELIANIYPIILVFMIAKSNLNMDEQIMNLLSKLRKKKIIGTIGHEIYDLISFQHSHIKQILLKNMYLKIIIGYLVDILKNL